MKEIYLGSDPGSSLESNLVTEDTINQHVRCFKQVNGTKKVVDAYFRIDTSIPSMNLQIKFNHSAVAAFERMLNTIPPGTHEIRVESNDKLRQAPTLQLFTTGGTTPTLSNMVTNYNSHGNNPTGARYT